MIDLFKKIFETNPKNRITVSQIKAHPWFQVNFVSVKGHMDKLKDENIQFVDEEVEKPELVIKDLSKEIDINLIPYMSCFEMATLISGKWVTKMFTNHKQNTLNSNNIFISTMHSSFYMLINIEVKDFLLKLHNFFISLGSVKYSKISNSRVSFNYYIFQ